MEYYSQIGQDKIALDHLQNKRNGYFVDIGCAAPFRLSNTATMEIDLGWKGLGFDLNVYNSTHNDICPRHKGGGRSWKERPNTKIYEADIFALNLEDVFEREGTPKIVDFLSIDLEPPTRTFNAFKLIPHDKYKFKIITFEHDGYRTGGGWVSKTDNYIRSLGYDLLKPVYDNSHHVDNIYVLRE